VLGVAGQLPPQRPDGPPPTEAGELATLSRRERQYVLAGVLARTLGTVAVLLGVYVLLPLDRSFGWGTLAGLTVGLLVVALLVAWQVRAILRARFPALRAVEALALVIPLFVLLFATVYVLLDRSDPGAFNSLLSRLDAVYLTVTVLSTVGFGDIVPVSEVARAVVTGQMIADLVLVGLVVKVVLDAVRRSPNRRRGPGGSPG
jgi:voltage-gated potassium channel